MDATSAIRPFPPLPADEAIEWRYVPGESIAHAFAGGRGWMRSRCRTIHFTIALVDAAPDMARCPDCLELVSPTEGENQELWGK